MLSKYIWTNAQRCSRLFVASGRLASSEATGGDEFSIPKPVRENETVELRRARLLYQSRKRGMLENDLLLSTFADKHLHAFTAEQLKQYDFLINEPSNDWDLYYWLTGKNEPPKEFQNEVFEMLQKHTRNELREKRIRQPSIRFT